MSRKSIASAKIGQTCPTLFSETNNNSIELKKSGSVNKSLLFKKGWWSTVRRVSGI